MIEALTALAGRLSALVSPPIGIVFVGASGSGKSTLLRNLREMISESTDVEFPVRLTTRRPRDDDEEWENRSIPISDLDGMTERGELLLRWEKRIGNSRAETYAFTVPKARSVVLGGNDALIENSESIRPDPDILSRLVKIAVYCDDQVRLARLLARSPNLTSQNEELRTRSRPTPPTVLNQCDYVVNMTSSIDREELKALSEVARNISRWTPAITDG